MGIASFTMSDDTHIPATTTDAGIGAPSDEFSLSAGLRVPFCSKITICCKRWPISTENVSPSGLPPL